ncbi:MULTISPECIES: hypothetical protein [Nonlabens]|uniref:YhhN-like protein n=2 Tax=Nonlabens ulvanivorans TaxID=906888 RepID=A0A084JZK2_NONUL|nr:hypothetical protein [Nonlabens ulvanivorans]KEZ94386.1 hypothetical protein IL45_01845 [Nonlabens ulvanivorans]PRX12278.1 hypothetical protein LY02_02689 [Nonlabens ulvanivorans]
MFLFKWFKSLTIRTQMLVLSSLFIVFNIVVIAIGDIEYIRLARILSTLAVFLYFIVAIGHYSKWLYFIYCLQVLSSIGFYYYDFNFGKYLFLAASILVYGIIVSWVLKSIQWDQIKRYEYASFLFIFFTHIAFHFYNVNNFEEMISTDVEYLLLLLTGIAGMTTCLLVGFSNATRSTFNSAYLMYATFAFVFADFAAMVAYYYELFPIRFYFIERGSYLFGLYILARFCYIENNESVTQNYLD